MLVSSRLAMLSPEHLWRSLGIFFIVLSVPLLVGLSDPVAVTVRDAAVLQCNGTCDGNILWTYVTYNMEVLKCVQSNCTEGEFFRSRASEKIQKGILSLILYPVVYNDKGWYEATCDSEPLCRVHLSVFVPTTVNPSVQDDVTLPCYAHTEKRIADGDVNILWEKNNRMVLEVKNGVTRYGSGFTERASVSLNNYRDGHLSLTLSRVTASDSGLYHCYYNNEESGHPGAITLTVTALQSICEKTKEDDLILDLFSLDWATVTFTGSEGVEIRVCSVKTNTPTCGSKYKDRVSVRNGSLVLQRLSSSDTGTFTVKDKMDEIISVTHVTVKGGTNYVYVALVLGIVVVVVFVVCIILYRRKLQQWIQRVCFNTQQSAVEIVLPAAPIEHFGNIGLSQEETGRDNSECLDTTHTPVEETTPMLQTTNDKTEPEDLSVPKIE